MDFQKIADSFFAPTCIISVERKAEGGYGDIRLVCGNAKYLAPIENIVPLDVPKMPGMPEIFHNTVKFVPNSLYTTYYPEDKGFEDICYRSAVLKIPIHTYIHMNDLNLWFDIFALPLDSDDGNICYCAYTAEQTSAERVGVNSSRSGKASEDVIKTCVKLHGTNSLKVTMDEVIKDIRLICRAEVCTIILADTERKSYSVLSSSFDENTKVRKITNFSNFGNITASWLSMFGDRDCLIICEKKDLEMIYEVNKPWYDTLVAAGVTSLVLFPLKYNNEVLGFVWATNFDTTDTMRIKETLELTTFFISSKLSTYKVMEHLKKISYSDQMTAIPNRLACSELIDELVRKNEPFAVVSIDINGFKSINDTLGFDAGNKVLINIADRWRKLASENNGGTTDYIARMGGDDFAFVLRGYKSDEDILNAIKLYEQALGQRMTIDGCDLNIDGSFGYSLFPDDAQTSDSIMSFANASMLEIKRINSSSHILRFTPELIKEQRTLEIERKLRDALECGTIYYALQPQFDMKHRLRGFEALARMKDTEGNFISPGEFIPVAEKVGLVDRVDSAVFRKAAEFTGQLIRETGADITLSVNVSVRHLMKNDFIDEVREIITSSGMPYKNIEIEITESIMIDSAEKALHCIDELHKMGIKIAIDDFGTGYSSLSYLNNFPANLLKIDKSFIDKMNTGDSAKQYVAAIISIGHIMGFDVISEGVEDEIQLEMLREIGCDMIQGFIWGRPLPPEEAKALVKSQQNMKKGDN